MKKYNWDIVATNSTVELKAKYLKYGNIIAHFSEFSGVIIAEKSFNNPEILFNINSASINCQNPDQDEKFKSVFYFSAQEYPVITFHSVEGCQLSSGGIRELTGKLSIKGIYHPITLIVNFSEVKYLAKASTARFNLFCHAQLDNWQLGNDDYGISNEVLFLIEMDLIRKGNNPDSQ